ncbi:unnamed protein product [Ectocarpus sp. 12 AP-2014]
MDKERLSCGQCCSKCTCVRAMLNHEQMNLRDLPCSRLLRQMYEHPGEVDGRLGTLQCFFCHPCQSPPRPRTRKMFEYLHFLMTGEGQPMGNKTIPTRPSAVDKIANGAVSKQVRIQ